MIGKTDDLKMKILAYDMNFFQAILKNLLLKNISILVWHSTFCHFFLSISIIFSREETSLSNLNDDT